MHFACRLSLLYNNGRGIAMPKRCKELPFVDVELRFYTMGLFGTRNLAPGAHIPEFIFDQILYEKKRIMGDDHPSRF